MCSRFSKVIVTHEIKQPIPVFFPGIPRNHPQSYHTFMFENLFQHIDIDPSNVNLLDGNAPDLEEECRSYEAKIKAAGGIELFMGG